MQYRLLINYMAWNLLILPESIRRDPSNASPEISSGSLPCCLWDSNSLSKRTAHIGSLPSPKFETVLLFLYRSGAPAGNPKVSTPHLCLRTQASHLPLQALRGDLSLLQLMLELCPLALEGFNFFSQRLRLFLVGLCFQLKAFFKMSRRQRKKRKTNLELFV